MDRRTVGALTALAVGVGAASAEGAAQKPREYSNCVKLNRVYPHGVARKDARDRTSGTPSVRTFKVYKLNASRLDRDDDGIACKKL